MTGHTLTAAAQDFHQRMHAAGLSLLELGDVLGIHPHHLHTHDTSGGLAGQPVHALIELAARLDLHPADFDHPRHVLALEWVLRRAQRHAPVTYDELAEG